MDVRKTSIRRLIEVASLCLEVASYLGPHVIVSFALIGTIAERRDGRVAVGIGHRQARNI
jgi:hypothetical protein